MITLLELRNSISISHRRILNAIWSYFQNNENGIDRIVLHGKFGKTEVLNALTELGGSIVYETQERYQLTSLGFFLTDEGNGVEELLIKYAQYLKEKYMANPEIEKITNSDVQKDISLSSNEVIQLGEILRYCSFLNSGYSYREDQWSFSIPRNIDDYPEIDDIRNYVLNEIVRYYDKGLPVNEFERNQYPLGRKDESNDFWFIEDHELREQIKNDWNEIQNCINCQAWKSSIILCGGVLEGVLWHLLSQSKEKARQIFKEINGKDSDKALNLWTLSQLLDVAYKMRIIKKSTTHLSHALREFRNLIHPEKQLSEHIKISSEEANIAINTLRICIKDIEKYCK